MREDMGALSGSREPSPDGLGPSGFDPARVEVRTEPLAALVFSLLTQMSPPPDGLPQFIPLVCTFDDKKGNRWDASITTDDLLELATLLPAFARPAWIAIAMEAATAGETEGLDTKCDSAGRNGIAQTPSPSRTNP